MAAEENGNIFIDASPEVRAGVFCDLVVASTRDGVTRLDFIHTDVPAEASGDAGGVLSSRIFMSNASLVRLRDMLDRHTSNWEITEAPDDAE